MSFSQRSQLTEPFKIATMHQRGYLLEIAPSFQSWFICFFDDRWRQSTLSYYTIDRNARDYYWSLDLLRRGHSPANQWAALGPFQGLRKLYHYYRGTSVGMQYIDDEQIYKHLAAALARGQMEVHKVYDPHEAYRAFAAAAASSGASSNAASDDGASESKPETQRVGGLTQTQKNYIAATCTPFYGPCASPGGEEIMMKLAEGHTLTQGQLDTIRGVAIVAGSVVSGASLARSGGIPKVTPPRSQTIGGASTPLPGTLSELETRKWYHAQEDLIPEKIDASKPLREQALQAFQLRNSIRTEARDLMSNRELAAKLDVTDPNLTLKQIVKRKYQVKGLAGDDLWANILKSSTESRPSVDKSLGLTRKK